MGMNVNQWGLATESEYGLNRIGNLAFTREQAEKLREQWAKAYPNAKPVHVINLNAE